MKHILLLVGVLGCGGLFDPSKPFWEIKPPEVYHVWWGEVEECAGQRRSMERVTWFTVAADSFPTPTGWVVGYWDRDAIYITESDKWSEWHTVKHEMLHAILQDGSHISPFFGVCAALADPPG